MYEKDLEITVKCLGPSHVSVANTKYNIALVFRTQGNREQSQELFRQAGKIYSKVYGESHSETVDAFAQAEGDENEDDDSEEDVSQAEDDGEDGVSQAEDGEDEDDDVHAHDTGADDNHAEANDEV